MQRVDEALDIAGEDSSQAEEVVPGDTADAGKPPSKLKTPPYPFLLLFVSLILYHASIILKWFGIVLVIVGKLHHPIAYLFGRTN